MKNFRFVALVLFSSLGVSVYGTPTITSITPASGPVGASMTISGANFGAAQGSSAISLNSASVAVVYWSDSAIVAVVPAGASSGSFSVSVAGQAANSPTFTVTALPAGWSQADIGSTGGSGSYANGTFTVQGAGQQIWGTVDAFHFVFQPLSGDGTIVARLVSLQGNANYRSAGVMIRETLDAGATNAKTADWPFNGSIYFDVRATAGATTAEPGGVSTSLPYWVKVVRSGSTFTSFAAPDGVNWTQIGSAQTINMAQNVYVGLAATSGSTSALATATFDSVTINSATTSAPVITGVSATTGSIGSQVTINGSGFGAGPNGSVVLLNLAAITINSWSDGAIVTTIPSGATSGPLLVAVAPSMNNSNAVAFTVTSNPLPSGWVDRDIGLVGVSGSGTYANGTFTVQGAGQQIWGTSDAFHFVYQPLSGDGTIVARVASFQGSANYRSVGVMIRETLDPAAVNAKTADWPFNGSIYFDLRTTASGTTTDPGGVTASVPYWVKVARSGNTFTSYLASDGVNWTQIATGQTINMAQNVYVGLAITSGSTSAVATAAFDSVSISSAASPAPVITSVSATTGSVGSQVTINGSGFGASQNSSVLTLNYAPVTINSWGDGAIVITIPSGATSGPLLVAVAPTMNNSNPVEFTVTSNPLPSGWLDWDIGVVGVVGGASYSSGTFTVQGAGQQVWGTTDGFHFVYQPLSGDGTIVARVASFQGSANYRLVGVMIRETLDPAATNAKTAYWPFNGSIYFDVRTTVGGTTAEPGGLSASLPYWVKVVRSSNTFTGYSSSDGVNWTEIGNGQTINMAQNVYVGLAVTSGSTSAVAIATFDHVSLVGLAVPYIGRVSPSPVAAGSSVTITGANFGATQGSSTVKFNGSLASAITSWSTSQIVATVASTTPGGTGPVSVVVNSVPSNANITLAVINPAITSLTPPWGSVGGTVVISGSGFGSSQGNGQIQFNSMAASVISWTDTRISATIPPNASSGPVAVANLGLTSNGIQFTLEGTPTITALSPPVGVNGSVVTITGGGFGAAQSSSTVQFNQIPAAINSWSDTQITATIAPGMSTGPVGVTVAGIATQSAPYTINSLVQVTDSLGNASSYTSTAMGGAWGNIAATGSGCSSCTVRGNVQTSFDTNGNILSSTDELGHVTNYTYDASGNVASQSAQLNANRAVTTSYTYNSFNEPLTVTDPLGNTTNYTYDANGNLLTVTSPAPTSSIPAIVTQFAYDSKGELTQITDPLNNVTKLTYTRAGLLATITDAQQNVTTYQYDAHGNRTAVIDALQHQTSFGYDAMDRLTTITYPDQTTASFGYDSRGRRTSVTDQSGRVTTYTYDDADRLTQVKDAANNVTQYTYDTESNLLSVTDAKGHTTSLAYDAFGRVTQTTFPSNLSETYLYDAAGNLVNKTDRNGHSILYVYDALNRLSHKGYPDSTGVDYVYDLAGKIKQVTDQTGTYGVAYDNIGRPSGTTTQYSFLPGSPSPVFSNSYSYDAASNRTTFTIPDGGTDAYAYDALNRMTTLTDSLTGQFSFSYDTLSRRTSLSRPNSVNTSYTYDSLSRPLSILHKTGTATVDGASYAYDNVGNRTIKTNQLNNVAERYAYDTIYELTGVSQGTTTTESYTYDAVGNRLSSLSVPSYNYNSSNELTSTPITSYTYDNNGNTLIKTSAGTSTQYTWDFENRLSSVILPGSGGTVTFKYDPFGRRIQKSSLSGMTNYLYDGRNVIEEIDGSGNEIAGYTDGGNIDEPLAERRSGTTVFYEQDGLGSVTSLSSLTGTLANTYIYDSFGNLTASAGSLANPFQYTGRDFDSEAGLRYYRARYYDGQLGRFMNQDPSGFEGGINFYAYVTNNPVRFVDPLGLQQGVGVPAEPGNCMAHALGATEWVGPQAVETDNPNWPVTWMPTFGGLHCIRIKCSDKFDCKKRKKVVVFVDLGDSRNWHAMGQQCNSLWTSKNGAGPVINDIQGPPSAFYRNNFHPKGKVRITCWSCHAPGVFD